MVCLLLCSYANGAGMVVVVSGWLNAKEIFIC